MGRFVVPSVTALFFSKAGTLRIRRRLQREFGQTLLDVLFIRLQMVLAPAPFFLFGRTFLELAADFRAFLLKLNVNLSYLWRLTSRI